MPLFLKHFFFLAAAVFFCGACAGAHKKQQDYSSVTLTFTGDLMAHRSNTKMSDFSLIYRDVEEIFKNDTLTFTNLETPVNNDINYGSYPRFSVKHAYPDAAINAGIDVFALANNHMADTGEEGVEKTYSYFKEKSKDGVYCAGIRKTGGGDLDFKIIEKDGWKILFVSATEFANSYDTSGRVVFAPRTEEKRELFKEKIKKLRKDHPADIMVLALHVNDTEYALLPSPPAGEVFQRAGGKRGGYFVGRTPARSAGLGNI